MTGYLLEVEHVSKGFPGVQALSDMHLNLCNGEVLALVGENGAGKSTLMKLLSGIYSPDSGSFLVDGGSYLPHGPREAAEAGISIIHQEFNLVPHLSVAQNIYLGREPRAALGFLSERRLNRDADALIERLGLPLDSRARVGGLTVAQQQMVEIAKALSTDARVLILDEPTAALNDSEVATLHDLIRRFVGPRTGAVYISHRMDELKAISDRITVIRDGRYVDTLATDTATMPEVISRMVGRELASDGGPVGIDPDAEVVLEVTGLATKDLLQDVSFVLRRGEILGFAGLMGAGRTEVARALVGADRISAGVVRVNGEQISVRHPADAARSGIGYLSEDRKHLGVLLEQTVTANVTLPSVRDRFSRWGFVQRAASRECAALQVERLGVRTPSTQQLVKHLSGGNQQKVVIAKWLVKDCDVLIFDEPTRGIDVGAKEEIYALLNELTAQGKSIVMISSELPELLRMSHRVVVMAEGRISGELTHQQATQERVMALATRRPSSGPSSDEVGTP